jgi:hypothetical protein
MKRREFITFLGGAAAVTFWLPKGFAQSPSKRPLVACVVGGSKMVTDRFFGGFLQGMRELGYAEGRDYGFDMFDIRRRDFITLLGGAAAACTGRRSDRMISRFIGESYG